MKNFILLLTVFAITACSGQNKNPLQVVNTKMKQQEEAWNNRDLEGFMIPYWHSDSLVFIGKSGLTYGWQQTLDNYKDTYSTPEEMGTLKFENKIVRQLDPETIQVIGKWLLIRPKEGDISGHYSLVWKLKNGEWVIISDHSS